MVMVADTAREEVRQPALDGMQHPIDVVVWGGSAVWRDGIAAQLEDCEGIDVRSRPESWDAARTALTRSSRVLVCLEHTIPERVRDWLREHDVSVVWLVRAVGDAETDPATLARLTGVVCVYAETTALTGAGELAQLVREAAQQRFVITSAHWAAEASAAITRMVEAEWVCDCGRRHTLARLTDEPEWDVLTPKEREVVKLVATGLSNPKIAERLCVSVGNVKKLLASALRRLALTDRKALIAAWTRAHG